MSIKTLGYYREIFVHCVAVVAALLGLSYVVTFFIFWVTFCIPFLNLITVPLVGLYWSISLYLGTIALIVCLVVDFYWAITDGVGKAPITTYLTQMSLATQSYRDRARNHKK